MSRQENQFPVAEEGSLYSILNLPVSASQDDIRHRYKELAVIFHPDRQTQRDENTLRTAEMRFRQIQQAYEVLTDPEQRQIYDAFGEGGLAARKAIGQRYTSPEELRAELERLVAEARGTRRGEWIVSRGEFLCGLDTSDVFGPGHDPGLKGLRTRLGGVVQTILRIQHTMGVKLQHGIDASLSGRIQAIPFKDSPRDYGNILGTIRYQYSPRIHLEATANLLRSHAANFKTIYDDDDNHVSLKAHFSPRSALLFPPLTLELQRRLFVQSLTQGHLVFVTGTQPSFTASLASPLHREAPLAWSTSLQLTRLPSLSVELISKVLSGGFKAKIGAELGFAGLSGTVGGMWTGAHGSLVSVAVGVAAKSLYTNVTLELLGQRIQLPIVLSHEPDVMIGLCAILVPSTLAALAHNFMIKPRLRARRISQLQVARDAHRDTIRQRRHEAEATITLLSEGARRREEQERSIDGLVLLAAKYVASGEDGELPIYVDVTVPLQAQVHNSQLLIPGGRSKAGLLGFYDPSPGARKHLQIEYLFRGALHAVDVGDFSQVVLPLRAHLVA